MNREEPPQNAPFAQPDLERIRILGRLIRQKRVDERFTLERAAKESGVSAATLSRLERQAEMKTNVKGVINPDTSTITALVRWLGISLDDIIAGVSSKIVVKAPGIVDGQLVVEGEIIDVNLPQIVEAYLRADRNLSPQAAKDLAEMFDLAYRQRSRMSEAKQPPELPSIDGNYDQSLNTE